MEYILWNRKQTSARMSERTEKYLASLIKH